MSTYPSNNKSSNFSFLLANLMEQEGVNALVAIGSPSKIEFGVEIDANGKPSLVNLSLK